MFTRNFSDNVCSDFYAPFKNTCVSTGSPSPCFQESKEFKTLQTSRSMHFLPIFLSLFHMMHVGRICHKIKAAISSLVTTDSLCYCDLRVRSSTDVVRRKYILITNASLLIQPRGPYGPWNRKPLSFKQCF